MSNINPGKMEVEDIFLNGYCHKCFMRERRNYYLESKADSLCHKCYKISEFCVSCFQEYHTDNYLCEKCYDKWCNGLLSNCPYCKESDCKTYSGDPVKLCSNNNLYTETNQFNSLFNFIYCKILKNKSQRE